MPKPGSIRRPVLELLRLRGYEQPELRVQANAGNYIGGGEVPGLEGSFVNDDVQYRVRHITGAVGVDPSGTMASNGSGARLERRSRRSTRVAAADRAKFTAIISTAATQKAMILTNWR